jgi:colicin import membrane protein
MKTGTTISAIGHGLVLAWCLVSFSAKPFDLAPVDSVAVDVISENDLSRLVAGSKTAPQVEKPRPIVDKIGPASEPVKDPVAKPVTKPPVPMAEAAPPPAPKQPDPKPPKPLEAKLPDTKLADAKPPQAKPPETKPAAPPVTSDAKPDLKKPEPDPIAEALKREEAKQKEDAKKAEEAKRREEARKRDEARKQEEARKQQEAKKQEENKFDLAKIETALLDKRASSRQIVTGSLVNPTASLGTASANAPELSQNEVDALRAQLMGCWNPPVGVADAKNLIVVVRFALNRDGSVSGEPSVVNHDNNALFQVAAESATRAVRRCQPFRLPAAKYEAWRDVEVKFDPNEMFRG